MFQTMFCDETVFCLMFVYVLFSVLILNSCFLRNKSWKPECVLSFNMGWRITFTNIRQPMLKLKTHSGFNELIPF
jgi:hypothetical protein